MSDAPIIRTSERSSFKRCPQQWWWAYREGLRGKAKPADALWLTGLESAFMRHWPSGMAKHSTVDPSPGRHGMIGLVMRYVTSRPTMLLMTVTGSMNQYMKKPPVSVHQ